MQSTYRSEANAYIHWVIAILGITYAFYLTDSIGLGITDRARLCYAFNEYALSILDGRLDVPPQAIGLEGRYTEDGRVYTYYGLLPALLRIPLVPFLDLSDVCVAKPMMLIYTVAIGFACHITIVSIGRARVDGAAYPGQIPVLLLVFLVWFASPLTILTSSAAQTYEPIALALLLTVMFFGIVIHEVVVEKRTEAHRILTLAILAALCVHARPNVAVLLYAAVVFLGMQLSIGRAQNGRTGRWLSGLHLRRGNLLRVVLALLILFVSGASLLAMNYARWQSFSFSMPSSVGQYGYFKFVEPEDSPRRSSSRKYRLGTFSVRRVPSNTAFHVFGTWELRTKLLDRFGGGHVRIAPPYSMTSVMWLPWYLGFAFLLIRSRRIIGWLGARTAYAASIWLAGAGIAYLILAYVTVTYRYKVELWPLLYVSSVLALSWWLETGSERGKSSSRIGKVAAIGVLVVSSLVAVVYSYQQNRMNGEVPFNHGSFHDVDCNWDSRRGWSAGCADLPK